MSIEAEARAELEALGGLRSSTLAETALLLARRLDGDPGDREVVLLARELRMTLRELQTPEDPAGDVERFLERIAAPDVGHSAD